MGNSSGAFHPQTLSQVLLAELGMLVAMGGASYIWKSLTGNSLTCIVGEYMYGELVKE